MKVAYQNAAFSHCMLILIPSNDFFLFEDFKSVAFACVFLLDEQDFSVGAFTDDTYLREVLGRHRGLLVGVRLRNNLLVLLDLFLSLNDLQALDLSTTYTLFLLFKSRLFVKGRFRLAYLIYFHD